MPDRPRPSFKQMFNALFAAAASSLPSHVRRPKLKLPKNVPDAEPLSVYVNKMLRHRTMKNKLRRPRRIMARASRQRNRRRHAKSARRAW